MAHDRQRQVALAQTRQSMIRPGYIMSQTLKSNDYQRKLTKSFVMGHVSRVALTPGHKCGHSEFSPSPMWSFK